MSPPFSILPAPEQACIFHLFSHERYWEPVSNSICLHPSPSCSNTGISKLQSARIASPFEVVLRFRRVQILWQTRILHGLKPLVLVHSELLEVPDPSHLILCLLGLEILSPPLAPALLLSPIHPSKILNRNVIPLRRSREELFFFFFSSSLFLGEYISVTLNSQLEAKQTWADLWWCWCCWYWLRWWGYWEFWWWWTHTCPFWWAHSLSTSESSSTLGKRRSQTKQDPPWRCSQADLQKCKHKTLKVSGGMRSAFSFLVNQIGWSLSTQRLEWEGNGDEDIISSQSVTQNDQRPHFSL